MNDMHDSRGKRQRVVNEFLGLGNNMPVLLTMVMLMKLDHQERKCSFETTIEQYGLVDKGLLRLAKIVTAWMVELSFSLEIL